MVATGLKYEMRVQETRKSFVLMKMYGWMQMLAKVFVLQTNLNGD